VFSIPAPGRARSLTVVVPTYREAESIPHLVARLQALRESEGIDLDVLFMDDDSRDGSEEVVRNLSRAWVQFVVRTTDRGLSQAVLEGLRRARGDMLVVMDADLSLPPEVIPDMVKALDQGADFVVGSRFTSGGSTSDDWGVLRWINSRVATLLAAPLTTIKDPMSGFLALRRQTFEDGRDYNPIGYKIGLELIIKCRCKRVVEIPIHFVDRIWGESKLTLKEQFRYLQHLRRLYIYKFGTWSHLLQFMTVGASGLVVNLVLLTLLLHFGVEERLAVALPIGISMIWNFALNRRFSFSYARSGSIVWQFFGFVTASSLGALVNYFVTRALWNDFDTKQIAALLGIAAGTGLNFVANRFVVFRRQHVRNGRP